MSLLQSQGDNACEQASVPASLILTSAAACLQNVLDLWAGIGQVYPSATTFFMHTLGRAPTPDQRPTAAEALRLSWFRGLEAGWTPYTRTPFCQTEPQAEQCPGAAVLRGGAWDDFLPKPVQHFVQQWGAEPAQRDSEAAVLPWLVHATGQMEAAAAQPLAQRFLPFRALAAVQGSLRRSFRWRPQHRSWLPHRWLLQGRRSLPQDRHSLPHGHCWLPRRRCWLPHGQHWLPHRRRGCKGSQ